MDSIPFNLNRKEENLFLWEVLKKLVDNAGGQVTVDLSTKQTGEVSIKAFPDHKIVISTQEAN